MISKNWKKVNSGSSCALLNHVEKCQNSPHYNVVRYYDNLMKQLHTIDVLIKKQTAEEIDNN